MEKVGVEVETDNKKYLEKTAEHKCKHPATGIVKSEDGSTEFCKTCGIYLKLSN